MAVTVFNNDVVVNGTLSASGMTLPSSVVANAQVAATAGITVGKTDHLHKIGTNFGIEADTAPSTSTTYTFTAFVASGACTVRLFKCTILDSGSQANTNDFNFNIKKGGVGSESLSTMLSSVVALDSDTTDNTPSAGNLTTTTLVAGDVVVLEVVTPGTITGAHGIFSWVEISEAAN